MKEQNQKIVKLYQEITNLATYWRQAIDEIDGLCGNAYTILTSFENSDWNELKMEIIDWNNNELEMLGRTLSDCDGFGKSINDTFFLGYIFTLVDNPLASQILDQDLYFFFSKNVVTSVELLHSIRNKFENLQEEHFIDRNSYKFWVNKIEEAIAQARC